MMWVAFRLSVFDYLLFGRWMGLIPAGLGCALCIAVFLDVLEHVLWDFGSKLVCCSLQILIFKCSLISLCEPTWTEGIEHLLPRLKLDTIY
jgi:hypothetical protein